MFMCWRRYSGSFAMCFLHHNCFRCVGLYVVSLYQSDCFFLLFCRSLMFLDHVTLSIGCCLDCCRFSLPVYCCCFLACNASLSFSMLLCPCLNSGMFSGCMHHWFGVSWFCLLFISSSPVVVSVSLPVCVPPVCVFLLSQILLGPRRSLCIDPCSCFWVLLQILSCLLHVASLNYCRWPPVLPPVRERFHRSPYLLFGFGLQCFRC